MAEETPDLEFKLDPETAEKLTELSENLQSIDIGGGDIITYIIVGFVCFWLFGGLFGMVVELLFAVVEGIFWSIWHFIKGCWWVTKNGFRAGNDLSEYLADARASRRIDREKDDKEILNLRPAQKKKEKKKNRPVDPFDEEDDFSDFE